MAVEIDDWSLNLELGRGPMKKWRHTEGFLKNKKSKGRTNESYRSCCSVLVSAAQIKHFVCRDEMSDMHAHARSWMLHRWLYQYLHMSIFGSICRPSWFLLEVFRVAPHGTSRVSVGPHRWSPISWLLTPAGIWIKLPQFLGWTQFPRQYGGSLDAPQPQVVATVQCQGQADDPDTVFERGERVPSRGGLFYVSHQDEGGSRNFSWRSKAFFLFSSRTSCGSTYISFSEKKLRRKRHGRRRSWGFHPAEQG